MTADPPLDDDEEDEVLTLNPPLLLAKEYLTNARRIGEPGQPTMTEGRALQAAHADMARTAALVAIADDIHKAVTDLHRNQRRLAAVTTDLHELARELYKIRTLATRGH